jgi:predicted transcriptional regulator
VLARRALEQRYNRVILIVVKTAISLSDATYVRVERAAKRLGVSRSEFFARAAENWLEILEGDTATQAIDEALAAAPEGHEFTDVAAARLIAGDHG